MDMNDETADIARRELGLRRCALWHDRPEAAGLGITSSGTGNRRWRRHIREKG